jgi:hypothetical protein
MVAGDGGGGRTGATVGEFDQQGRFDAICRS